MEDIDVTIADRADAPPPEMLDDIVVEYIQAVMFDGQRLIAQEAA